MQSAAKHLARFIAYALCAAPRQMLRYTLHDKYLSFIYALFYRLAA
jgi:hypothetical protein